MTQSICIINQKGGVGKTTSAINIASFLALCEQNILLIDLDPQGNSSDTTLSQINRKNSLGTFDFFMATINQDNKDRPFSEYIKQSTIEGATATFDVMPANIKLSEIEIRLTQEYNREKIFQKAINHYKKDLNKYDLVIIDCPPSLGLLTINAFVEAKYLLVPVDASAYSHQGLEELVNSLALCNNTFNCNTELLGIFFAKFVERESVYKESYQILKELCQGRLFETVIRKSTQIEQAPHYHQSIVEYAPKSRAYEDYLALTKELIRRINGEEIYNRKKEQQTISANR